MSSISEEEKQKIEANKMFDIAEKPLMEYMCYFYKKTPQELFDDHENVISDKFILLPLEKDSDFIALSIEVVDKDYVSNIPENIKQNDIVRNSIGFLYNAVACVSNMILTRNIKPDHIEEVEQNFLHFAFDDSDFSFHPVHIFWKRRKSLMTQDLLSKINNELLNMEPNLIDGDDNYKKVYDDLKNSYEVNKKALELFEHSEEEALAVEKEKTEEYKNMNKLGIIYEELKFHDLNDFYKNLIKTQYPYLDPESSVSSELEEVVVD